MTDITIIITCIIRHTIIIMHTETDTEAMPEKEIQQSETMLSEITL